MAVVAVLLLLVVAVGVVVAFVPRAAAPMTAVKPSVAFRRCSVCGAGRFDIAESECPDCGAGKFPCVGCGRQTWGKPGATTCDVCTRDHQQSGVPYEKQIEREVIVTRCKFCQQLTPVDLEGCRSCGAPKFS